MAVINFPVTVLSHLSNKILVCSEKVYRYQKEQIISLMGLSTSAVVYGLSNVMVNSQTLAPEGRATHRVFRV